jgi:hypothetical protein
VPQHKVVFDGANKRITVNPGVADLDIRSDVYSAWKEWARILENGKFAAALRTIGGDPTIAGQRAGDIYFLINGWKLVIDLTQTRVNGALFSDDYDTAYYNDSLVPLYPVTVSSLVNTIEASTSTVWEATDAEKLRELWRIHGLDQAAPLQVTDTSRQAGAISQAIDQTEVSTTITRQ